MKIENLDSLTFFVCIFRNQAKRTAAQLGQQTTETMFVYIFGDVL